MIFQAIQMFGASLILAAFVLSLRKKLDANSIAYLLLNMVGAGILAVCALLGFDLGFLFLEGSWSMLAGWDLFKVLRTRAEASKPKPVDWPEPRVVQDVNQSQLPT